MKYKNILLFYYLLGSCNIFTIPLSIQFVCYMSMFIKHTSKIKKLALIKNSCLEHISLKKEEKLIKYEEELDNLYKIIEYNNYSFNNDTMLFLLHHKILEIMEIIISQLSYQEYDVMQLIIKANQMESIRQPKHKAPIILDENILRTIWELKKNIIAHIKYENKCITSNNFSEVQQIIIILKEYFYCTMWYYFIFLLLVELSIVLLIIFVSKFFIFLSISLSILLLYNNPFTEYIRMIRSNHETTKKIILEDNIKEKSIEINNKHENLLL